MDCVREHPLNALDGPLRAVGGQAAVMHHTETAQLIETDEMVIMLVGVEDCIKAADVRTEALLSKVGGGVHDKDKALCLDEDRGTQASVVRVG